jgi:hypothetical protein
VWHPGSCASATESSGSPLSIPSEHCFGVAEEEEELTAAELEDDVTTEELDDVTVEELEELTTDELLELDAGVELEEELNAF